MQKTTAANSTNVDAAKITGVDAAKLIAAHQAGVWRYLRVLGCDAASADDLTQETFLAVMQSSFQDIAPKATAAYLRRTAHNLFISDRRRRGREVLMDDLTAVDQQWTQWAGQDNGEAFLETLRECLQSLTERARQALELRFRNRESRTSIANALQLSDHGARNLMQRAKQKLRECISGRLK